jgi:hypothetical protein
VNQVKTIVSSWCAFAFLHQDNTISTVGSSYCGGGNRLNDTWARFRTSQAPSSAVFNMQHIQDVKEIVSLHRGFAAIYGPNRTVFVWGHFGENMQAKARIDSLNREQISGVLDVVCTANVPTQSYDLYRDLETQKFVDACAFIDSRGKLYAFGKAQSGGVLPVIDEGRMFRQVVAGKNSFAALDYKGSVLTWGNINLYYNADKTERWPVYPGTVCPGQQVVIYDPSNFRTANQRPSMKCIPESSCTTVINKATQSCDICDPGTYATTIDGTKTCSVCQNGQHQPEQSRTTTCTKCAMGTFIGDNGTLAAKHITCDQCPDGQLSEEGASYCYECPAGKFRNTTTCEKCEKGEFTELPGLTSCKQCPTGWRNEETGSSFCSSCGAGFYEENNACKTCLEGTFTNSSGLKRCEQCPSGFSQSDQGQAACAKCSPGEFNEANGAHACKSCSEGEYTDNPGLTTCKQCPSGWVNNFTKNSFCLPCSPGEFQQAKGQDTCSKCPSGWITRGSANLKCEMCQSGRGANEKGSANCIACGIAKFSNVFNKRNMRTMQNRAIPRQRRTN